VPSLGGRAHVRDRRFKDGRKDVVIKSTAPYEEGQPHVLEVAGHFEHDLKDGVADTNQAKVLLVRMLVVGLVFLDADHQAKLLKELGKSTGPDVVGLAMGELRGAKRACECC